MPQFGHEITWSAHEDLVSGITVLPLSSQKPEFCLCSLGFHSFIQQESKQANKHLLTA